MFVIGIINATRWYIYIWIFMMESSVNSDIYVVPPQSWGDRSDTKHSKCLLLGGWRLNQNDFNPQTEGKWWRVGCDGPSRPSK